MHFVVDLDAKSWQKNCKRILLPDEAELDNLRHRWCWEQRNRPYVPCWDYAKFPNKKYSVEENSRMLCVYMRPWTLNKKDANEDNPLLANMGLINNSSDGQNRTIRSYATAWGQ